MHAYKKTITILLAIVFSIIFWNEKLGVNLFLFTTILSGFALYQNQSSLQSFLVKTTLLGTLLSGVMVVIFNSFISKFVHISSFWLLIGVIHYPHLRSFYYSIQYSFTNILFAPKSFLSNSILNNKPQTRTDAILYTLKLTVLPLIVLLVFYILFYNANEKFAHLADAFWSKFGDVFSMLFNYISFGRLFMIILGLLIVVFAFYKSTLFSDDSSLVDTLSRARIQRRGRVFYGMNILKQQYKTAVILVLLVNMLLLVFNVIDISWIWFNFTLEEGMVLKHFVHEGTYLLIMSILLSMGIILWFFRNNINFYPHNNFLKCISLIWMVQNMVLCVSVFIRNYHYINYHGLAYKRIGVIIFLVLTLVGLVTMIVKIKTIKSAFYMVRINTLAAYIVFIMMACVNWDIIIVKFNLSHWNKSGIDVGFYFTLSPKAIPIISENLMVIDEQIRSCNAAQTNFTPFENINQFKIRLYNEKLKFIREQQQYSWLSWNASDYKTLYYIIKE
jgi:hypothetical protein